MTAIRTVTLSNTARGPRGAHVAGEIVMLDPGKSAVVGMSEDEITNARETDGLTVDVGGAQAAPADDGPADLSRLSIDELTALAAERGVALPTTGSGANGRVLKSDIVAAIEAGPADADDGLADMSDEELRSTVETLTGSAPAVDASRAALIALVRGG